MGATAPTASVQAGSDTIAAGRAVLRFLGKGDIAGHEFHGNQWTGSIGHAAVATLNARTAAGITANDIPRAPTGALNEPQRAIETRFANYIASQGVPAILAEYAKLPEAAGGKVLNTDTFRELSADYRADRSLSAAVHEPASYLTKLAFAAALAKPPETGMAVFTAGGAGAGKSSAVAAVPEVKSLEEHADFVYDSNMNDAAKTIPRIDATIASGRDVTIVYVGRDPVDALKNGALPRAMRMGRTVPLSEHVRTHVESARAIQAVREHYAGNPRVHFAYIDNSLGRGAARLTNESLPRKFDYNNLETRLKDTLNHEYAQGHISERVYRGTLGKLLAALRKAIGRGEGQADRGDDGQEPELERHQVQAFLTVRKFLRGA